MKSGYQITHPNVPTFNAVLTHEEAEAIRNHLSEIGAANGCDGGKVTEMSDLPNCYSFERAESILTRLY